MHYVVVRRRAKLETTKYHHILLELHLGDLLGVLIRDQFELEFDIFSPLGVRTGPFQIAPGEPKNTVDTHRQVDAILRSGSGLRAIQVFADFLPVWRIQRGHFRF